MRVAVAVISIVLLAALVAEFFVVFLLPRRVKRDPAIARAVLRTLWIPWRRAAAVLGQRGADTMLGIFGPLGLLTILALLSVGVIAGFAGLYWAHATAIGGHGASPFGRDLYFSAGAFFSASTPYEPSDGVGKALQVAQAVGGFSFLGIAIGYLPALFQAFSRRETAVARLDTRAGSPPTVGSLLERTGRRGGWHELEDYLREWETWTAELMETHLSYPILAYFRSQHVNQNWLAALTTVVDACAYTVAHGPDEAKDGAILTFRVGRHALADLAGTLCARRYLRDPGAGRERLTAEGLHELQRRLEGSGLHSEHNDEAREQLQELRASYEPFAFALARQLALDLPDWLAQGDVSGNWRALGEGEHLGRLLP